MNPPCVIDRGARFEGVLAFETTVRIKGEFVGKVRGDGLLVVAEGARIEAQVEVGSLRIDGELEGDVLAREKIIVGPGAQIRGRLETAALEINEGASLEGPVTMTGVGQSRSI